MVNGLPLQGRSIVVTRPVHQAAQISQQLQDVGAEVINFPLLDIVEPSDTDGCRRKLAVLDRYDFLIFTSPNAVECALSYLTDGLPETVKVAAVGKKTAQCLSHHGISVSIVPSDTFNSESLLACADLQAVKGLSIAIIRGEGGRSLLRETLSERGACVDYIDVYRRICPADNLLPLVKLQQQSGLDIIILTSVESLHHLFRLGKGQLWLNDTTLLVGSERIASMVKQTSHAGRVLVAPDPSDGSIFSRIQDWVNDKNR
ncbi:uroporphyrinogen-III synthase [Leucothrix pacifica]|uniref:Uroporphyrinogen-III synthase n=1 Tax=Leucothrix pacifica TaxID=1247513 RepID=A0A317C7R6_9GAMM|nr:uroporphyrinogen-III synthase [Leucothrix pacifica]PWQ94311.1 uroporphyrinogen III synthase [Leucothrix pacifica]